VVSNARFTRDRSSLMIYDSMDLCGLSNPRVTRDSSSLMISDSLGAVLAVESTRHT